MGADGKLCEYSKRRDMIYKRRVYPVQTAFVDRLYETRGVPAANAQQIEERFMSPIDGWASRSLTMLENGDKRIHRDPKFRSAWSLFILTLLMRMPEDLQTLDVALEVAWKREIAKLEVKYLKVTADAGSLYAFIDTHDPEHMSRWKMEVACTLMDHDGIGQLLNDMRWFVVDSHDCEIDFLTSDRPVLMSETLTDPESYVFVPISPRKLFVAVNDAQVGERIWFRPRTDLTRAVNDLVVGHAKRFAYGKDDSQLGFVSERLSKRPQKSLLQRLADLQAS